MPSVDFYNRQYGKKRWKAPTVISLAIGQDALVVSPIQMANMCAAIANRGYYFTPHVVRKIGGKALTDSTYTVAKQTSIDEKHFKTIIKGMEKVYTGKYGTAKTAQVKNIEICGKTGTAENPHGEDHSIFIAFAPKDKPQIAIAVYVENGGWGSTWAAPIASLIIEKYLTGQVNNTEREDFILSGNLMDKRMRNNKSLFANIDWPLVCIYLLMLFFGWLNIYAANYGEGIHDLMTMSSEPGKQLFWIGTSFIWILLIIILDGKFYTTFSYPIYILMICLLIGVLLVGKEIGGAKSWFDLGSFSMQPSEFAKIGALLALSKFLSQLNVNLQKRQLK